MQQDGIDTNTIKTNKGEEELTISIEEEFDRLEREGADLHAIGNQNQEPEKSEKTGRKVPKVEEPEPEPEPEEEPEPEPEPEEELEPEPEEELEYSDESIDKVLSEELEPDKPEEHSRADDDDAKAEIEEIRNNPHTKESTKKGIDRLLGSNNRLKSILDKEKARAEALEQEIEKLKAAKPAGEPILDEERHELNMLRMRHNIGSDEEIKNKYDTPIAATEKTIYDIVERTLDEDQANQVKKMGFETFARNFPKHFKQLMSGLEESNPLDATILSSSVNDLLKLNKARQEEVQNRTQNADKYFEDKKKEQDDAMKRHQEVSSRLKSETFNTLILKSPTFADFPTKGLSGEKLKLAESLNSRRAFYRENAQRLLETNTIEERQKLFKDAALAPVLFDKVKELRKQIKQLEAEKGKVSKARGLKPQKEKLTPKEEVKPPSTFGEGLDAILDEESSSGGFLSSTRSIPR